MKKLFLVLLAGGIMMTACKKEDKEMPKNQNHKQSWKTSDWVLTKENVNIDGNICDEYQNLITGQKIYEAKMVLKNLVFDGIFYPGCDPLEKDECKGDGNECMNATIDGQKVIILRRLSFN